MLDPVDEIKNKLDIVSVVSQYVQLKQAGRNFKACCPFHSEKTASFVVSPEKQICHCFGCNKGGDIFSFIQEVEGISFVEAMQILADKAGVKLEKMKKINTKESKSEKDTYFKAHELASVFFEEKLFNTNDGEKVLKYLSSRGVKEETIKEFRIGFSPNDYAALYPFLLKKGISKDLLFKAGFVSSKKISEERIYDKFRGRLMFPIFNYLGKICGFGGRALAKDQMPKYLNSSENPIYNKSNVLYGLSHAKQAIKEKDQIVLVEGYFDVILPHQAGIKNLVASSGTALTVGHIKLIKRLTKNVITCFDADKAGFEATKRAYSLLSEKKMSVKTVAFIKGKDPADFVKEDKDAFVRSISDSEDFFTIYMDRLINSKDINVFENRSAVIAELMPYYKKMDAVNRDFYIRSLSSKLNIKESVLYDELENLKLPASHPAKLNSSENMINITKFSVEELILSLFLEYPKLFKDFSKSFNENDFTNDNKRVYNELTNQYTSMRGELDSWSFNDPFWSDYKEKIDVFRLFADDLYGEFSHENLKIEIENLLKKNRKIKKDEELRTIQLEIEKVEKLNDKDKLIELLLLQQKLLSK